MDKQTALSLIAQGEELAGPQQPPSLSISPATTFPMLSPKGSFTERNSRGFKIDTETGAPAWVKFQVALRDSPEQKLKYLQDFFGQGNARLADTGEPLVKTLDNDGNPIELKINEDSFTLRDLATFAAQAPEMVGGAAAMVGARKLPLVGKWGGVSGVTRDVVAESVGSEMLGGVPKDVTTRAADSLPVTAEVLSTRAKNIPLNIALGGALEGGARVIGKGVSPFGGSKTQIEEEQQLARQYFREQFGIDVPMTAGEKTGSAALQRVEATMSRLPGSSKEFTDIRAEKQDRLTRIQNKMLGLPEEATSADRLARANEEQIGEEAVTAIRSKIAPVQAAVETAEAGVKEAGTEAALETVTGLTKAGRELYPETVGAGIRSRAVTMRDEFKAESSQKYETAYALPGGTDRSLTPDSLPGRAQKLMDELPSKEVTVTEPTGVTGPRGEAITRDVKGREVLKEFIPEGVLGKLKTLSELKDQKFSLRDLVRMRSEVDNEIARGEAIPGVQTHFLSRIRGTMTEAIEEATDKLPDARLKTAWKEANDFYKSSVGKFEQRDIARLFKDIESRGFVRDEDIVKNIGPSEYKAFKEFLGPASNEFKSLQRSIADSVIEGATLPGEALIDGKALVQQLSSLKSKNRAIYDDVFGAQSVTMQRLGELMSSGARVDKAKFASLIQGGTPLETAVDTLVAEQRKLDKLYRSKMLKDIAEKKVGDEGFDPAEFVNRFYNTASSKDVRAVIEQLHDQPELLEKIRLKVAEKIFFEAQRFTKDLDPARLGRGEVMRPSTTSSLHRAFGDEVQREKLELILGRQTYRDFDMLAKLLRGSEMNESAMIGAGAGGLAAGMQVSNMMRHGVFSYASEFVKQKAYAIFLTNPAVRAFLTNQLADKARVQSVGTALLVFRPFIEAVVDEFGEDAEDALLSLKTSADQFLQQQGQAAPPAAAPQIARPPNRFEQALQP